jgi:hypothetical protein
MLPGSADRLSTDSRSFQGLTTPSFDVLAYYLPFHFYRNRWGIYINASGALELARCLTNRGFLYKREQGLIGGLRGLLLAPRVYIIAEPPLAEGRLHFVLR